MSHVIVQFLDLFSAFVKIKIAFGHGPERFMVKHVLREVARIIGKNFGLLIRQVSFLCSVFIDTKIQ